MLLQYCSDLHLEFPENELFLKRNPLQPKAKVLILAGDIVPFAQLKAHKDFFDLISDSFEQVYWLPGNHEYYGGDISERSGEFRENIRNNILLLNNAVIEMDGVRIAFTTLWTSIGPRHQWDIEQSLNDFSAIKLFGRRLRVEQVNYFHSQSTDFLNEVIRKKKDSKTVVVTHHVPTFFNYPEKYRGSEINEAFGTELFDLIHDSGVDNWIYGHHHENVSDFEIGKTLLVTNQLGYVRYGEQKGFGLGRIIG